MRVLKLKWKYEPLYFNASNDSQLQLAFLAMVLKLDSDLRVYETIPLEIRDLKREIAEIGALKVQKKALKLKVVKEKLSDLVKSYDEKKEELDRYEKMHEHYKTLKNKKYSIIVRAEAAKSLAYMRKDHEYEEFVFVRVDEPAEVIAQA